MTFCLKETEVKNISFKPGMELRVTGVPKSNQSVFSINVGHSDKNIALHVKPCFHQCPGKGTIILNYMKDGSWNEEQKETHFPFQAGQQFEVTITFTNDNFYINLHDGHMLQYSNRLGGKQYNYIFFVGDVVIHSIYIK